MATVRRTKWHPPPPPTPRILHLPRRSNRRKHLIKNGAAKLNSGANPFLRPVALLSSGERGRGERREEENGGDVEERESEEKLRFEAEMLRLECNFLRMEREIAMKKLKRERGFKSALHTLLSGKKKIREGKNVNSVVEEEEIEELTKKLVKLQRRSKVGEMAVDGISVKDIQVDLTRDGRIRGCTSHSSKFNMFADVENLRRKMKRLSKGKLLKRMEEEYGSMLSATTNCSLPSSTLTCRQYDLPELSSFSFQLSPQEAKSGEPKTCSGHCKAIVRRIMEQVRAETEQWSQMQEMLGQLKGEMEELQASRNLWENRALQSDNKIKTLKSEVEKWKQKAVSLEIRESQVQKQVLELQQELEKSRMEKICDSAEEKTSKDLVPISLGVQLAKEKQRLLTCLVKGSNDSDKQVVDYSAGKKEVHKYGRHPFKDIGNMPPLMRQNSRRYVYPLHSPKD